MFKLLAVFASLLYSLSFSSIFADCCGSTCCQSVDVSVGWRRDSLDWKLKNLRSCYASAKVDDHIFFKDINSYTISTQAKWVSSEYYVRLSAEYGLTDKGRAQEHFNIKSPDLFYPIAIEASNPIKRRSEVYDFDGAVGYPFLLFDCRLSFVPLIGFSFHRQRLRVKEEDEKSSHSCCHPYYDFFDSSSDFSLCHSSSSFLVSRHNPFIGNPSSNPFSSHSSSRIASRLGLNNPHDTSNYRFTWYGFYLGADIAFAVDRCWTLFWNTEIHYFNSCHRKRKSWTGVYFIDDYHKKGSTYGFNNSVGLTYYMANCWYTIITVDFNWWKAQAKHDHLEWKKVGAKIGLLYAF